MEITEIGLLAIKAESAYGTDPVPTVASNLIPTVRDSLTYTVQSSAIERKPLDGTTDSLPGFNAMPNVELKFRYELRGNRTDGAAPDISAGAVAYKLEIDPILQAANLTPVYAPESIALARDGKVRYLLSYPTDSGPSVTAYWWTALKLHKLIGGKVDLAFIWVAGEMIILEVTIRGKYVVPVDTTFPTTGLGFVATKPSIFELGQVSIGGYTAAVFKTCSINLGNQIAHRPNALDATGIQGFVITGRQSKGSIDPESVAEATKSFWADWRASTVYNLILQSVQTQGTYSGNRFTMDMRVEPKSINYATRDGLRTHDLQFNLVKTALGGTTPLELSFA